MNHHLQNEGHPSRLELERWLSGEASGGHAELDAHLGACADCAAQVAGMQTQGERFRFRNPTFATLSARQRRTSWVQRMRRFLSRPGKPAMAFATLALAVAGAALWTVRPEVDHGLGVKGAPSFLLFDARQNLLDPRDTVHVREGDTLQLAIASEVPVYYRIFSRAENGELSELMPLPGELDFLGASLKGTVLPHSLVFAAPVQPERILCVWSRQRLDWKTARAIIGSTHVTPASGVDSFQVVGIP
jgi:hypothetical protein